MSAPVVSMLSPEFVAGNGAILTAMQAELTGHNAAAAAVGNAVLPPGNEAASHRNVAQQMIQVDNMGQNVELGIMEMLKFAGWLTSQSAAFELTDLGNALSV